MPRQKAIMSVAIFLGFVGMAYIGYRLWHSVLDGDDDLSGLLLFVGGNLVILYIGTFEIMQHTAVENWKQLLAYLLAPIIIMTVLWLPSMYWYVDYYWQTFGNPEGRSLLAQFMIPIIGAFFPFWPAIIGGFLTKGARGL